MKKPTIEVPQIFFTHFHRYTKFECFHGSYTKFSSFMINTFKAINSFKTTHNFIRLSYSKALVKLSYQNMKTSFQKLLQTSRKKHQAFHSQNFFTIFYIPIDLMLVELSNHKTFFVVLFITCFRLDTRCTYDCIGTSGKKLPKPP